MITSSLLPITITLLRITSLYSKDYCQIQRYYYILLLYYYIITTSLLRNITKLLHSYYSLLLAANSIIFNYYVLMSFTTFITSSLLLITWTLLRITPKPLLHITFLSVSNTTYYLRNVIRSNETITTYYVPGQHGDVGVTD